MTAVDITALRAKLDEAETAARTDEPGYPWVQILGDAYLMPRAVTLALVAGHRELVDAYDMAERGAQDLTVAILDPHVEAVWRFWMETP